MDYIEKEEIKTLLEKIRNIETQLYHVIEDYNNTMTECDCEDRAVYDFKYTLNLEGEPYHYHLYCVNCGGFIEPKDIVE